MLQSKVYDSKELSVIDRPYWSRLLCKQVSSMICIKQWGKGAFKNHLVISIQSVSARCVISRMINLTWSFHLYAMLEVASLF